MRKDMLRDERINNDVDERSDSFEKKVAEAHTITTMSKRMQRAEKRRIAQQRLNEKRGGRNDVHLGGGPGGGMPHEKPKDFKGTLRRTLKYLEPHIPMFVLAVVFAIVATVASSVAPRISALAINKLQEGILIGKVDTDYIIRIVIITIALYVFSSVLSFISYFISAIISQKVVYKMRYDIKEKLKKLPIGFFDTHPYGNVLSVITNDIETISVSLQESLSQAVTSLIALVIIFAMMLSISPLMTLIAVASLPLFALVTMLIAKRSQKKFVKQQATLGELNGYVEEMFSNKRVVQLYNKTADAGEEFEEINEELYKVGKDAQALSGAIMPSLQFIDNLSYVATCIVGAALAGIGKLMIGDITAFIQYSKQFGQPIMQTANIANTIQSTIAAAERLFRILDQMEEPEDAPDCVSVENVKGTVELRHVDFSYDKSTELIKDVNLKVEAGGVIAIVGPTGAGKTTLVNLLMRFYEIDKGEIFIDGIDIRKMRKTDLRSLFGMVLQDTWLESGTIRDNIAYGKSDATDEEIKEVARQAHIDHYIDTLPDGYDTVLNDEVSNISQGQRQLFTIARAILSGSKILILDEATSSVDTKTESYIQNAMTAMMKGKTSFIIAHRLSTIRNANLILVMNDGRIVEQGTHNELLAKKGFYQKLYDDQFSNAE